jgi:hypothetical protein
VRISPTHNVVDDFTWIHGKHSFQFGGNVRFMENDRTAYNNYPSYSLSRNTLKGLGNDITNAVTAFMRTRSGNSTMALTEASSVTNAFGTLFGIINSYGGTYQYNIDGSTVPIRCFQRLMKRTAYRCRRRPALMFSSPKGSRPTSWEFPATPCPMRF